MENRIEKTILATLAWIGLALLIGCKTPSPARAPVPPPPPLPTAKAQARKVTVAMPPPASVDLGWNYDFSGSNVLGIQIGYGPAPGTYTNFASFGQVTNATLTGLEYGAQYYIAARATNADGFTSDWSNELLYVPMGAIAVSLTLEASSNSVDWIEVTNLPSVYVENPAEPRGFYRAYLSISPGH